MPTYLYKNIETGDIYEIRQSMRDEALTHHPDSGVPIKRVLARPGIAFKGSGFYATDSRPPEKTGGEKSGGEAPKSAPARSESPKSKGGE